MRNTKHNLEGYPQECIVVLCFEGGDKTLHKTSRCRDDTNRWVMSFLDNPHFLYGGDKLAAWFSEAQK